MRDCYEIGKLVIRKSMVPTREPKWFHDWSGIREDGTWFFGFFSWLIYIKTELENK